jgi:uncharacterized repeat protein (TIGR03806 family)
MLQTRIQSLRTSLALVAAVGIGCGTEVAQTPVADVVDAEVASDLAASDSLDVSNEPPGEDVPDEGDAGAGDAEVADVEADATLDVADVREVGVDVREVGVDAPADVREAGVDAAPDVADVRDVTDAPDAPDAPPPWGLDARPRNATCVAFARPTEGTGVALTRVFPSLPAGSSVVGLLQAPGAAGRWYVVEQAGRVFAFNNSAAVAARAQVLDIRARVSSGGELGLLGMAFHPSFATNGQVFLSYTGPRRAGMSEAAVSRLSRFRSRDGGATIDPASEEVLLEISQPYSNHNGGHIAFGPDGLLYLGMGDGGSGGDPMRHGQNLNSLLGKFLRIDVNRTSTGRAYGIPADNPFATGGGAPEVYAWGLRNPWRWSFDRATGALWAGDVGQGALEEVDVIRRGGNYGWNVMEGTRCYNAATCNRAGLILPVAEYDRSLGVSITGGYVYRGSRVPWLVGSFLFADFQTGRVWRVAYDAMGASSRQELAMSGVNVSTFGEGVDGEVYVVSYGDGRIFRVDPGATTPTDTVPATIRATGCVSATNPLLPATGLVPYAPNAPFWSDGADKERFMALPDGGRITVGADGDWSFPVGTVLVKNFSHLGRRIETRLMVRHADGDWAGYTWRWNDAQTDAALVRGSDARDLPGGLRWYYPSRAECLACHTTGAGRTLGLETVQLNGNLRYAQTGRTANQLATLDHLGMFAAPLPAAPAMLPRLADPYGGAPAEQRVRAYLHTNCAQCHRPGGTGRGPGDFRHVTLPAMWGVCNVAPATGDLGVAGARLLLPGDPARSVISLRMRATGVHRMPPISSGVVDAAGVALFDAWVSSLRACP